MGGYSTGPGTQTFVDSASTFVDDADSTKVLAFQLSSITTATTRTATWQDISGTVYISTGTDVTLADGGTNASLTASNGGIFYSTASAGAILAGTATANQVLLSGSSSAPAWSTAVYPATTTINQLLYSSSANTVAGLGSAASGVLVTSGASVPSIATDIPTAVTIGAAYIHRVGGTDVVLADGGTNASLTASDGGIFYSTATAGAILAGTATANQLLTSGASTAPAWTTTTYPSTNAVNTLLYASSANVMAALATANNGTLITDSAGTPTINTNPRADGWFHNLAIATATTTNANDSIKITSASGTALSATNSAWIDLPGITAGTTTRFAITADVTILTTGAHWGRGTTGDITGGILRVLAANDNGTLKWGIACLGGRNTLLTTDTTATQTSVTTPEGVLCNTAVASATNSCRELGFVRANFDDTGGAAEDLWANQTGVNDIYTGITADGYWQPWNPVFGGFSANPTVTEARWTQIGRIVFAKLVTGTGTSNAVTLTMTAPAKSISQILMSGTDGTDNGASLTHAVGIQVTTGSTTINAYATVGGTAWTGASTKRAGFNISYEAGPAASFIE